MTRFLPPWRTLLPAEHGSWFMLGFPMVLGLLLRPTAAGLCLALAALSLFLARPPLRRLRTGPRDGAQVRALLLCTGLALAFGTGALAFAGPRFLVPLAAAGGASLAEAGRAWVLVTLVGGANLAHVRRLLGHAHGLAEAELSRRKLPVHALHLLLLGASAWLLAPRSPAGLLWTAWTGLLYLRALRPWRPLAARTLGWREGGLSAVGLLLLWRALVG